MEAHADTLGTWELDPTVPQYFRGACCLKMKAYGWTVRVSDDGKTVTFVPQNMSFTFGCFTVPDYNAGMQVASWNDELSGYHFPGNSGDIRNPEYILRSIRDGNAKSFEASDPKSVTKIIFRQFLEGDKMRIEGPDNTFGFGMRRVGRKPSPPPLLATMEMVSPTTMTMDQHKASTALFPAATAPAAKPGYINITVPQGKKGGDILEDLANPKGGMSMMVLIPYNKKEGDVFEHFVG
ncbi:hypothetical protein ScalyP_jg10319 [Parmales sp. scaly parma]|nr:hypothetical protein ScalyP_jg10319 [Parmales sp. scaly parma]